MRLIMDRIRRELIKERKAAAAWSLDALHAWSMR
jgi:hypothetical protein